MHPSRASTFTDPFFRPSCSTLRRRLRPALAAALLLGAAKIVAAAAPAGSDQAYFDGLFAKLMDDEGVPGLAAVLVRDGRVVFQSGYGWADLAHRTPIDPARTLFPLGSLSKVLTSVAVLQLAEAGAVDLHADVARYAGPVAIDRSFAAPITLHHLLTHSDGFDVRWLFGAAGHTPQDVPPLAQLLARTPRRVYPPGELYHYGDVGMTLAGYVVQQVSREPFADYMDRHVFAPLGMRHSSFRPDRLDFARDRATGYDYDDSGKLVPVPVLYPKATPASGLTGPVADLAPLMIALLRPDQPRSRQVLDPHWLREMTRLQYTQDPRIPGTGYAVYECYRHGHRAMIHGGLVPGYTSVMILLPGENVGLGVAANLFDLVEAFEGRLVTETIDRFAHPAGAIAPADPPSPPPVTTPAAPDGLYRCNQYSRFSIDRLAVLAGFVNEIRVESQPDGSLRLRPDNDRWRPAGRELYQNERTGERIAFRTDAHGHAFRIVGSAEFMSYDRLGLLDRVGVQASAAGLLVLVAGAGGVAALLGARRSQSRGDGVASRDTKLRRWLAVSLLGLVWTYAAGVALAGWHINLLTAPFGEPRALVLLRYVPAVFAVVAVLLLAVCAAGFRTAGRGRTETAAAATSAAAALLLLPVLAGWNLLLPWFSIH